MTRPSIVRAAFGAALALALHSAARRAGAQTRDAARDAAREPYPGFDAYAEAALRTWKVPGAAVAIVRNDSVIHARGYGVRQLGRAEPATARTLFAIGSSSKAFTAAAVAMLVDSGKMSLDAPAATYLPGLQLADPYASRELTLRDMLAHRAGIARAELAWYGSPLPRGELVRRLRFVPPASSFRGQMHYQNTMFLAAGQAVAHVAGTSWDDFVRARIFAPLGMTATNTSVRAIDRAGDVAMPHAEVNDTVRAIAAWRNVDNIGPAGSVNSTAADMAQWLRLQLGRGSVGGRRLISARMVDEMHTPQIVMRLDSAARAFNPDTHMQAYGLGWMVQDYRGRQVVQHGGAVDGFMALVAMLPEERLGIVVLTNLNGTGLPTVLMHALWDRHLRAPPRDWSADLRRRAEAAQARSRAAQQRLEAQRVPNTRPSLPLAAYAGTYVDSLYGEVVVREQDGKLALAFGPTWRGTLDHWHFDTFRTRFDTPVLPAFPVVFRLNAGGKVDEVELDMAGPATFRRRPEPASVGARP